jgi:hypothetical protein
MPCLVLACSTIPGIKLPVLSARKHRYNIQFRCQHHRHVILNVHMSSVDMALYWRNKNVTHFIFSFSTASHWSSHIPDNCLHHLLEVQCSWQGLLLHVICICRYKICNRNPNHFGDPHIHVMILKWTLKKWE